MQGTTITRERFRLDSVDDALGNRRGRFFGEGFKRVTHGLEAISVRPADTSAPGGVEATAGIRIPGVWSRKGESHQRPHLSTIDAMQFAAQLTGLYAAHVHDLPPSGHFVVRSLCVKAGCTPDEEFLDRFPVSAQHESTLELPGTNRLLTTMDCRIGSMTVRVEAEHSAAAAPVRTEGFYAHPEYLPGGWNDAPYGASHHTRHQYLLDVAGDADCLSADAELRITEAPDVPGAHDATAREPLEPTMVDLFVAALQLGQVLLYRLDGLDRATSNTLWMRGTTITPADEEPAPPAHDRRLRVVLARPNELPTAQGTWRAARIQATYGGLRLACNVAHLLP